MTENKRKEAGVGPFFKKKRRKGLEREFEYSALVIMTKSLLVRHKSSRIVQSTVYCSKKNRSSLKERTTESFALIRSRFSPLQVKFEM